MQRYALILTCCLVPAAGWAQTPPDVPPTPAERAVPEEAAEPADEPMTLRRELGLAIAQAYGFDAWERVEEIRFTFNVKRPDGQEPMRRVWTWEPKTNQVALGRMDEPRQVATINDPDGLPPGVRGFGMADEHGREMTPSPLEHRFINDSYWLLFPFQIVWSNPELTDHGQQPLPIPPKGDDGGDATARKVTVQYPKEGGFTPGDAYDLYLDDDLRIVQWTFRRGGGENGSSVTWEGERQLGPIVVSTEHRNAAGERRLWFTDLSVKVRADDGEIAEHTPEPLREAP